VDLQEWISEGIPGTTRTDNAVLLSCRRCRSQWLGPTEPGLRQNLGALYRASRILEAYEAMKVAGFAFRDAKPTVLHLSPKPGVCNRCKRSTATTALSTTCVCGSLNLNW
jgi:hypothetical protein